VEEQARSPKQEADEKEEEESELLSSIHSILPETMQGLNSSMPR
jgi:hypothetical protein